MAHDFLTHFKLHLQESWKMFDTEAELDLVPVIGKVRLAAIQRA